MLPVHTIFTPSIRFLCLFVLVVTGCIAKEEARLQITEGRIASMFLRYYLPDHLHTLQEEDQLI